MKLIPMTDFVLEQVNNKDYPELDTKEFTIEKAVIYMKCLETIIKYAEFLKQPITLGMFVPCDEDGIVLTEPSEDDCSFYAHKNLSVKEEYQQAKERVLFEDCKVHKDDDDDMYIISHDGFYLWNSLEEGKIIESLTDFGLTLTQTAINQIFN